MFDFFDYSVTQFIDGLGLITLRLVLRLKLKFAHYLSGFMTVGHYGTKATAYLFFISLHRLRRLSIHCRILLYRGQVIIPACFAAEIEGFSLPAHS
jgi:hypothetical protein